MDTLYHIKGPNRILLTGPFFFNSPQTFLNFALLGHASERSVCETSLIPRWSRFRRFNITFTFMFICQAMAKTIQHFQTDNITVISTQSFIDDPAPQIEKLIVSMISYDLR